MNRALGFGVAAVLALGLALGFTHYFERVALREYVGFKGEAARNDFLAAERFLQRLGHTVQQLRGLTQIEQLDTRALLIWSRVPSETERVRLLDWVKRGGHLLLDAPQSQEMLLREVEVKHYWPEGETEETDAQENGSEADAAAGEEEQAEEDASTTADAGGEEEVGGDAAQQAPDQQTSDACAPGRVWCPPPVQVTAAERQFSLEVDNFARLQGPQRAPLRAATDVSGAIMLEYPLGKGHVTAVAGSDHLRNHRIGQHDHATWLRYLVGEAKRAIWFANVPLAPSLWEWLKGYAWPALLAAAIAIVLGVWRALSRFGPVLPEPAPGRLSFRDHLVACGRFQWRHGAADHLLASVEQEVQRGQWAQASTPVPFRHIAGQAADAPRFVRAMKALQQKLIAGKHREAASRERAAARAR